MINILLNLWDERKIKSSRDLEFCLAHIINQGSQGLVGSKAGKWN